MVTTEAQKRASKNWKLKNRERLIEYDRKRNGSEERKSYLRIWGRERRKRYTEYRRKYIREYQKRNRLKIIELLGGKCSNPDCLVINGCSDIRCLQIDHVNGGGTKFLKSPYKEYRKILKEIKLGSKNFQLLCANCNWIKKYENKEVRKYAHQMTESFISDADNSIC